MKYCLWIVNRLIPNVLKFRKIASATFVFGLSLCLVFGHEFWLQPSRFFADVDDKISLQVLVGEGFQGERSEGKKNRIIQYRHYIGQSSTDLSSALTGDSYGDVTVSLKSEGTHLFSFTNTPKFLTMKPDSFLLYLEEDGLDNTIAARKQQGNTDKPSRELYQRCVKTLVQVGSKPDDTFAKNTGMKLEIIPTKNPYAQRPGDEALFTILFDNKPVEGALVRYWNRNTANKLTEEKQRSDKQGHATFKLRAGSNMISLIRMVPHENKAEADWHSYWGSLTFGCQ
ncbi:DUF4198 domain-containing protein [Spirosoma sp. BT702]|uniref:DUF4198 domain-containing protein n=1 Tax=Spirosoma profusum TaxID=2771354 RepID=A0A926Y3B7_9BACT|nr:DUF4198 domain-containing protein [Spirosoma profusum]MBD2703248.1 DUF4198 domain-containing protein [Spirosoma profusum]